MASKTQIPLHEKRLSVVTDGPLSVLSGGTVGFDAWNFEREQSFVGSRVAIATGYTMR